MSKWLLFLVFFVICYYAGDGRSTILGWLLMILGGFYVFAGVSGFLEDKRNGALEMLLVTPVSPNALIFGRAWGLWKQFLPAAAVLAVFYAQEKIKIEEHWSQPLYGHYPMVAAVTWLFTLGCGFVALPIFATYFALRVKNLLVAGVWTVIGVFLPFVLGRELTELFLGWPGTDVRALVPILVVCYGGFVYLACRLLRHSLARRIYAF